MFDKKISLLLRAGIALSALLVFNLQAALPAGVEARNNTDAFGESAEPSPEFQVVAAKLNPEAPGASVNAAGVLEYSGRCPVTITFKGYIKTKGPGTVYYTFGRSDGAIGPKLTLVFERAGIKEVSTTWTLGDASRLPYFEGFEEIRITYPNRMGSNKAKFKIKCSR